MTYRYSDKMIVRYPFYPTYKSQCSFESFNSIEHLALMQSCSFILLNILILNTWPLYPNVKLNTPATLIHNQETSKYVRLHVCTSKRVPMFYPYYELLLWLVYGIIIQTRTFHSLSRPQFLALLIRFTDQTTTSYCYQLFI